jgi:hypothetical protein
VGVKRRRLLLILAGIFAVAVVTVMVWPREKEPEGPIYRGRSLQAWLERYRESSKVTEYCAPGSQTSVLQQKYELGRPLWVSAEQNNPEAMEAATAIRKIGTNGVPFLIKWIQYRRSGLRRELEKVTGNLSVFDRLPADQGNLRATDGMIGLQVLGNEASLAVPYLAKLASSTNSAASERAMWCLLYLGRPALEWFAATLADQNLPNSKRMKAGSRIEWMRYVGVDAIVIAPQLQKCARDTNIVVAEVAARNLGLFRLDPGRSVPALSSCLSSTEMDVRLAAVAALHQFGKDAEAARPALTRCLVDSNLLVRMAATNTLRRMAPETNEVTEIHQ